MAEQTEADPASRVIEINMKWQTSKKAVSIKCFGPIVAVSEALCLLVPGIGYHHLEAGRRNALEHGRYYHRNKEFNVELWLDEHMPEDEYIEVKLNPQSGRRAMLKFMDKLRHNGWTMMGLACSHFPNATTTEQQYWASPGDIPPPPYHTVKYAQ